jgi:hypothetical protein
MTDAHELVLDIVRNRTDTDAGMPPVITHLDLVGRAAKAGLGVDEAQKAIRDLQRTDSLAGKQLVAHEIDSDETQFDRPPMDDVTFVCHRSQLDAAIEYLSEATEAVEA